MYINNGSTLKASHDYFQTTTKSTLTKTPLKVAPLRTPLTQTPSWWKLTTCGAAHCATTRAVKRAMCASTWRVSTCGSRWSAKFVTSASWRAGCAVIKSGICAQLKPSHSRTAKCKVFTRLCREALFSSLTIFEYFLLLNFVIGQYKKWYFQCSLQEIVIIITILRTSSSYFWLIWKYLYY